jgi:hypothetical protein
MHTMCLLFPTLSSISRALLIINCLHPYHFAIMFINGIAITLPLLCKQSEKKVKK